MRIKLVLFAVIVGLLSCGAGAKAAAAAPAQTSIEFFRRLEKGQVDEALKLWSDKALNERVKERIKKMSAKIIRLGGIKKLETPDVEKRPKNLASHETVVIVVYGNNKDLAFGSISFVEEDGQLKISSLRSEKGYGGTTSLFEGDESDKENADTAPAE